MKKREGPLTLFTNYEEFLDKILAEKGYYTKDTEEHRQNCKAKYEPKIDIKSNKITYVALVYPFEKLEEIKFEIEI